ncbi:MAG TPA: hypothetical protein VFV95_01520 [Vicinamibacterales bacterium]|nr:hypothetical protein [Vicinamibacterales bacterium]
MKRQAIGGCLFILASIFTPHAASAQTAVNVSARIGDFHVAVANYYHVPEREVVVIRERRISDDELPVVLFIAREARVPPMRVIEMRQRGRTWWDISVHYGLRPDIYYVPVAYAPGPPYGHAYGHYKKPKSQWKTIRLADDDVVNLVHLRFLSEHYRIPPERVMEARGRSRHVAVMYSDIGERRRSGRDNDNDQGGNRRQAVPVQTSKVVPVQTTKAVPVQSSKGHDDEKGKSKGNGRGKGHDR